MAEKVWEQLFQSEECVLGRLVCSVVKFQNNYKFLIQYKKSEMTHNTNRLKEMATDPDLTTEQIVQKSFALWLMTGGQQTFHAYSDKSLAPQQVRLQMSYSIILLTTTNEND